MEKRRLKGFRDKLLKKKQEILEAYSKNQAYGKETDGQGAQDLADMASNAYAKEFLFSLSNTERDMLHLVDEALGRIDKQSYGVCTVCSNAVERKRLDAVPWARHCLACQELQEQGLL
jgi:DnaK suppressor protein